MTLVAAFVRVIMSVGELLLVATLPALTANTLVPRVLTLATLGATVGTAAGCTRRALAARTAATATTATPATTTTTRLAVALTALPVGTAIRALRVLTFGARRDWRAGLNAISDVVWDAAVRISCTIYVAATVRIS